MSRGCVLRWIMLVGLIVASVPGVAPTLAAHSLTSARMRQFVRAAKRSGVPMTVLIGLAWEQSMLSDHHGEPSIDDGYGLLDLSARRQHDTLDAAAHLLHTAPVRLRRNDGLNVLGGALLLAQDERRLGYHRLPRAIHSWDRAVIAFTGMRSAFAAQLIIKDMDRALERGIHAPGVSLPGVARIRPAVMWSRQMQNSSDKTTETAGPADYPGAVWEPADYKNYSDARRPSGHPIRYIVIHDTESSCAAAANWFANPASQASAHYIVCLDGTVIQTVHERDIAWHAGNWPINEEAIGIEHEGYSDHAYYTRAQYLASAALVRYLCHKYGIDPNRNVIFGHENVPAANHTDPGQYWNWDFYMREVRGDATGYAGGITSIATVTGNADVYSCPLQSCSVLGSANWGEQFFISQERPGWAAVFYGGHAGWIPSTHIAAGRGTVLRVTSTTPVLSGPKAGDSSVGTISPGQNYVSLTHDGGFWYIYFNHRYGFVSTSAVDATSCSSPSTSTMTRACLLNSGSALAATPNAGVPGTAVAVAGTGLTPGTVTIAMAGQTLGTTQAGPDGSFHTTLTIPAAIVSGSRTLTAVDTLGHSIRAGFVISSLPITEPQISVTPSNGALPGEQVAVSGSGFTPENTVRITANFAAAGGTRVVQLAPTGPNGKFALVKLSVPSSAEGNGTITVTTPGMKVSTTITLLAGNATPSAEATITASPSPPGPATPTPVVPSSPTVTPSQSALILSPSVVPPGGTLQVMGFGFAAGSAVSTTLNGLRISGRTGKLGRFHSSLTVPASLLPGDYSVTASGPNGPATARLRVVAHLATTSYFPGSVTTASTPSLSLLDPGAAGHASVTYYFADRELTKNYPLAAHSERTVSVGQQIGAKRHVGLVVTASIPIAAERLAGSESSQSSDAGISHLSTAWVLPLLAASNGAQRSIAIMNPGASAATVHITSMGPGAETTLPSVTVPARRQRVLVLASSLLSQSLGLKVQSTQPVAAGWVAAPAGEAPAMDALQLLPRSWYFPAASTPGHTTLLAANPTAYPSHVTLTLYRGNGSVAAVIHHNLAAYQRATFHPRSSVGAALSVLSSQPLEVGRILASAPTTVYLRDRGATDTSNSWWFGGGNTRQPHVQDILSVFNPTATPMPALIHVFTTAGKMRAHVLIVPPHATAHLNLTSFVPNNQFGITLAAAAPVVAEQIIVSGGKTVQASYGTPTG